MRLLAVTSEPITPEHLRSALAGGGSQPGEVEVMVLAPALHQSALRFWLSDADEAIHNAERVAAESVDALDRAGVAVSGDVGESELETAIRDALATFPADRVILFTHPPDAGRYREDDADPQALSADLGVPVVRYEVAPDAGGDR